MKKEEKKKTSFFCLFLLFFNYASLFACVGFEFSTRCM